MSRLLITALLMLFSGVAVSHGNEDHSADAPEPIVLAPGYENLNFDAPPAGSYELPRLKRATDGTVLDANAARLSLAEELAGRITVLSFIYHACNDVNGCPLATFVMHQVRGQLESSLEDPSRVQLLSMSFDPDNDTPESIGEYQASFGDSPIEWRFLTSPSHEELKPLLAAWDQPITQSDDITINHVLRVFLIDDEGWIRNIYSASLLHADTVVNDIKTLLLKQNDAAGEQTSDKGSSFDLYRHAMARHLGLPELDNEALASLSPEVIQLGRALFFDRRLSGNDTFSCAMCHVPRQGFTVREMATAVGVEGRTVKRNAPTLLNVGLLDSLFQDGRERRLEQQIWIPLLAHNEMDNPSISYVLDKIFAIPEYSMMWLDAFGSPEPSMEQLGVALAAYQRSLLAGNSPFDRWHFAGEEAAVSAEAKHGFELFTGKAGCVSCHTVDADSALFSDQQLHNTGIGYLQSQAPARKPPHPVRLAPGVVVEVDPAVYADAAEKTPIDLGRYEVSEDPDDRWLFRTPGLRNVALTAPYMHDGSLESLADVVSFYNGGGVENPLLSPLIRPLDLSEVEQAALVAFLESLNSDDVPALVADALEVPVGDTGYTAQY